MAYKMKDFLIQYFSQKRFDDMSPGVRAQYDDFVKSGDMTGHMKAWHSDYEGHEVPNPEDDTVISDDELAKLYKEFLAAFSSLDAKRGKLENSVSLDDRNGKILSFMKDYFGPGKLFEPAQATPEAEAEIIDLVAYLESPAMAPYAATLLKQHGIVESQEKYDDFINDLKGKKYNSDQELKGKIIDLVGSLNWSQQQGDISGVPSLKHLTKDKFDVDQFTGTKPNEFRTELKDMLNTLYRNKKIREAFPATSVTSAFDTAKSQVAYDDANSKDYVPEKPDDKLSWPQAMSKWVGDTYSDTLEKFIKFRGDTMYFSLHAKQMVGAIEKVGLKPTDGLGKILDEKSKILEKLAAKPKAREQFELMTKWLGKAKDKKPKAFEKALQNGRQMRSIVMYVISEATKEDKIDEAKAVLEVLSVIKYGYTTSKIMDKLSGELDKFSVLSDPNMSWNKGNECMQMITSAMDKSVAFALKGVGLGITMVGNAIFKSGTKTKGKLSDEALELHNAAEIENAEKIERKRNAIQAKQQQIDGYTTGLNTAEGRDATEAYNKYKDAKKARDDTQKIIDEYNNLNTDKGNLETANHNLNTEIAALNAELNRITGRTPQDNARRSSLKLLIKTKQQKVTSNNAKIKEIDKELRKRQADYDAAGRAIVGLTNDQNSAYSDYEAKRDAFDNTVPAPAVKFADATAQVDELSKQIDEAQAEINDMSITPQMKLAAYWDMLETGRGLHTGPMYNWFRHLSAKSAQKSFNARAPQIEQQYLQKYLNKYGMSA